VLCCVVLGVVGVTNPTHIHMVSNSHSFTSWTLAFRPKKKTGGFGTVLLMGDGVSSTSSPLVFVRLIYCVLVVWCGWVVG